MVRYSEKHSGFLLQLLATTFIVIVTFLTVSFMRSSKSIFGRPEAARRPIPARERCRFVTKWGSKGSGEGQFDSPVDLDFYYGGGSILRAIEPFVATVEIANHRVQKFTPDGTFIKKWGRRGTGEGEFMSPYGIGVNPTNGDIFVSYSNEDIVRVQRFDHNGEYITSWGSKGSGEGQSEFIRRITVDSQGYVYTTEWGIATPEGNHRVQKFTANGAFIATWGSWGSEEGQFWHPEGIAVDSSGNVYVADSSNNRIQKFDKNGNFLLSWGHKCYIDTGRYCTDPDGRWGLLELGDGQFHNPLDISVGPSGNVYVTDSANHRIQVFTPNGRFLYKQGSWGSGDGEHHFPSGIAAGYERTNLGKQEVVFVSEGSNQIQKFVCSF